MHLTEAQIAAIAAGATYASLGLAEPAVAGAVVPPAAAVTPPAANAGPAAGTVVPPAAAPAAAPVVAVPSDVVTLLSTQLMQANAGLLAANVELAGLKAQAAPLQAANEGLLAIVRGTLNNMSVALKGSATVGDAMDATQAIAAHASMSATFKEQFKVGGVTAPTPVEAKSDKVDPAFWAIAARSPRAIK